MSKIGKKLLAAGLCLGLAVGTVTGCSADNAGKAVATLDGEKIDYALVNRSEERRVGKECRL